MPPHPRSAEYRRACKTQFLISHMKTRKNGSVTSLALAGLISGSMVVLAQSGIADGTVDHSIVRTGKPSAEIAEVVAIMQDVHSLPNEQTREFFFSTGDVIESLDPTNAVIASAGRITTRSDRTLSVKYPSGFVRQFTLDAKTRLCDTNGTPTKLSSVATNELGNRSQP